MKIFIDAGHNHAGGDKGASGNGLKEQDVTFKIAEALKPLLEGCGHQVMMSRNKIADSIGSTESISIMERAKMANDWKADLFVSIHCNAFNTLSRGTETLVYSQNSPSVPVAEKVQAAIVKKLGTTDRGVKTRTNLGVLWRTNMPALLVETAFIDNMHDSKLLKNNVQDFAQAICDGIIGKETTKPITEVSTIVGGLAERGIITDTGLWLSKLDTDKNAFWLAKKCLAYIKGETNG